MKKTIKIYNSKVYYAQLKTVFIGLSMGLLLLSGCSSSDPTPPTVEPEAPVVDPEPDPIELDLSYLPMGNGSTTPYMRGTFIDFWGKQDWSSSDWDAHMVEMKEVGIEILIVQFTAYGDNVWVNFNTNYGTNVYPDALPRLLDAAAKENIGVYVGLYFDDEYWNNATDITTLKTHAQRSKDLANEIWTMNKTKTSFKGWYITHEPAPYYYKTQGDLNVLKNNLIDPIADYCKSISGKPVGMSAFFNHNETDVPAFKTFIAGLGSSNIELLILQDGIGVYHCDLTTIESYYAAANEALYDNGFKGAFWADLETFKNVSPTDETSNPEAIDVVTQKMDLVKDYVSTIVTFQYYHDMSPTGPRKALAKKLRDDYLDYLP
ncbi:hypothetical protein MNBD_BACTEROID03-1778 [hydrothermal vent metagenome]|uniref:DUF4434 domain-containing protein n=1 Tax=hydrothermal vent metagenome TaxID=652676 RepID=A0A3B0SYA2_9ZZZZ